MAIVSARAVCAGEPPKPEVYVPPVMDETSKKVIEGWEKKVNCPGRAGVKKVSFSVNVKFSDSTDKKYQTSGAFKWTHDENGQKTAAGWKDKGLGDVLVDLGWPVKAFVEYFDPDSFKRELSGTKLTGKVDGERTIISINGKTECDLKAFIFNKDGILTETVTETPTADGKPIEGRFKFSGKMEGDTYLETGWAYTYADPKQGTFESTVTIKLDKTSGYYLWTNIEEKMVRDGKPFGNVAMEFTGYKVNDAFEK
jgi:hypothetical protein